MNFLHFQKVVVGLIFRDLYFFIGNLNSIKEVNRIGIWHFCLRLKLFQCIIIITLVEKGWDMF